MRRAKGTGRYNEDQKWNVAMAHLQSQCCQTFQQFLEQMWVKVGDMEDELQRESHCYRCPCQDGEKTLQDVPCGPSGWEPWVQDEVIMSSQDLVDAIHVDEAIMAHCLWGDEDEMELPIALTNPILISEYDVPYPASPSSDGESEVSEVRPTSTAATLVPDENIIPLPVVHGVPQSSPLLCHLPYPAFLPAPPCGVLHSVLPTVLSVTISRDVWYPGWGMFEEQVVPESLLSR